MPTDTQLLAIVAVINALGTATAAVIAAIAAAQRPRSQTHDVGVRLATGTLPLAESPRGIPRHVVAEPLHQPTNTRGARSTRHRKTRR